jgi:GNAT superfamily N-acetyltransferase
MEPEIDIVGPERLGEYSKVPISFEVDRRLAIELMDSGFGGIRLREEQVSPSYVKDYDASPEGGPDRWNLRFDMRDFVIFLAMQGGSPVGGATLVHGARGLHILAGRKDLAALWDIRVLPERRRDGIGSILFGRVADWARAEGLKALKIETQNINVPACRFYVKQGCRLGEINRHAYSADPSVAHEVMLVWYLDL